MDKAAVISKEKEKNKAVLGGFWTAAYVFLFCAFIGWVWEVTYCYVKHGIWVERGFLIGPYLPIYGIGGLLIYLLKTNSKKGPLNLFFTSVGVAGIVEYVASFVLELIYYKRWWDYSGKFLNINGRVYFFGLIFFGIAGCAGAYFVIPAWLRLVCKMKRRTAIIIGSLLLTVFFSDVAISLLLQFVI